MRFAVIAAALAAAAPLHAQPVAVPAAPNYAKDQDWLCLPGRSDVGAQRLRTIPTRARPCADIPHKQDDGDDQSVLLELDYWALLPR